MKSIKQNNTRVFFLVKENNQVFEVQLPYREYEKKKIIARYGQPSRHTHIHCAK